MAEIQTDRARTRDFARSVEYWKGAQPDQEAAYGSDTESSLEPPGALRSGRGFVLCGYSVPAFTAQVASFKKKHVETMWIMSGKRRKDCYRQRLVRYRREVTTFPTVADCPGAMPGRAAA
jgi:hypothetical protein